MSSSSKASFRNVCFPPIADISQSVQTVRMVLLTLLLTAAASAVSDDAIQRQAARCGVKPNQFVSSVDAEGHQQVEIAPSGHVDNLSFRTLKCFAEWAVKSGVSVGFVSELPPNSEPVRLEGMEYLTARKVILGYGWIPLRGDCGGAVADTCATFPEIGNCSGSGAGFCDMNFVRRNRCLIVVTVGGEPQAKKHSEPVVRDVQFRRGPCSKD